MIREVKREELSACADLIRKSFQTVADEFGFTRENAPRFTAFAVTEERLLRHMDGEHRLMYLDEEDGRLCGYMKIVLPETGKTLLKKDEYKESFPEIFRKHFGDSFILLTRDEVLSGKLFGIGKNHECLESMIGDYVALAVSDGRNKNSADRY